MVLHCSVASFTFQNLVLRLYFELVCVSLCVYPSQTTEREVPEGSLSPETSSVNHPSSSQAHQPTSSDTSQPSPPNSTTTTTTDVNQVLQEAQASLMKSIPDLDVSDTREGPSDSASGQINPSAAKSEQETPLDLTLQG